MTSQPPLHRIKSFLLPSRESFLLWLSSSVVFSKKNQRYCCDVGEVSWSDTKSLSEIWNRYTQGLIQSLSLVLVCKHLKMEQTLILSGKSPCKKETGLWTQMAFTIYRRKKKVLCSENIKPCLHCLRRGSTEPLMPRSWNSYYPRFRSHSGRARLGLGWDRCILQFCFPWKKYRQAQQMGSVCFQTSVLIWPNAQM